MFRKGILYFRPLKSLHCKTKSFSIHLVRQEVWRLVIWVITSTSSRDTVKYQLFCCNTTITTHPIQIIEVSYTQFYHSLLQIIVKSYQPSFTYIQKAKGKVGFPLQILDRIGILWQRRNCECKYEVQRTKIYFQGILGWEIKPNKIIEVFKIWM